MTEAHATVASADYFGANGRDVRLMFAPFSELQISQINLYQSWHAMFAGVSCDRGHKSVKLTAKPHGLECPLCGAAQDWAYGWVANWRPIPPKSR